jgi:uncharacterized MnhB-related membrane protein
MNRFVRYRHSAFVVSAVTSALIGLAVFILGAPPIILIPAVLTTGTIHVELKSRTRHRYDRH